MKTPWEILDEVVAENIINVQQMVTTKKLVIIAMRRYAKLYHKTKVKTLGLNIVSERYSKDDILKYKDGWWITLWNNETKTRLKLIGSFKTKQLAENEREILNAH